MITLSFGEWFAMPPHTTVRAKARIHDCPASREDDSVPRGTHGSIEDYDSSAGLLVVTFDGERTLLVAPDEIEPVSGQARHRVKHRNH